MNNNIKKLKSIIDRCNKTLNYYRLEEVQYSLPEIIEDLHFLILDVKDIAEILVGEEK